MSNNFKKFANSFQAVARLELEGITCLMKHLGNPQDQLRFVHVAGTNGKGSVCNFLRSILTDSGKKTGLYTSPNLISVCERISVDGVLISEDDINRILSQVEVAAKAVEEEIGDFPTQFEIWTAAAFCYFLEQKCDIVVLETGLGGARDATNVIMPPVASVITTVDVDHIEYLGDDLKGIAEAKAGIIKKGCSVTVSAIQKPVVADVLKNACAERENRLLFVNAPKIKDCCGFNEVFNYETTDGKFFSDVVCGITGAYQPENACIAIETAHALGIEEKYIVSGVENAKNPGRFEIMQKEPVVIYDGAHNKNGMEALVKCLKRYFPQWNGATFIMAFMGDKDIVGEFEILKENGLLEQSQIFVVKVKNNPRAAEPWDVCSVAENVGISAVGFEMLSDAYETALSVGKPVFVCGSLYLYKDFDEILKSL